MPIELFISHSSRDKEIAQQVCELIVNSMDAPRGSIRCTSIKKYALDTGAEFNPEFLDELTGAKVVLGIVSPNSVREVWPMSEMGAAWGKGLKPLSLLVGGLNYDDFKGPLYGTKKSIWTSSDDIDVLLETLHKNLEWKANFAGMSDAKTAFLKYANSVSFSNFVEPTEIVHRGDIFKPDSRHRLRWKDVFEDAQSRVLIWGLSLREIINSQTRNVFELMAKSSKTLDFLIMDYEAVRDAKSLDFGPVCSHRADEVVRDIEKGENELKSFRQGLEDDIGTKLSGVNFRKSSIPMSWSGVAIDHTQGHGRLQIEMYQYDGRSSADHLIVRPNLILNQSSPFYSQFSRSVELLWERGKPF